MPKHSVKRKFADTSTKSILITLLAVLIFFLLTATRDLWIDESATWWISQGPLDLLVKDTRPYPNHLPYYLITWLWIRVFGDSEISLRLPSLIAVILTCYFCCRIALSLFKTDELKFLGVGGIVLTFFFQEQILWSSVNARQYAVAVLFTTVSVSALIDYLRTESSKYLAVIGFFTVGSILAQPIFMPFLAMLWLGSFVLPVTSGRRVTLVQNLTFTLVLVALISFLYLKSVGSVGIINRLGLIYSFLNRSQISSFLSLFSYSAVSLLLLLLILLVFLRRAKAVSDDIYTSFRRSCKPGSLAFLSVWLFIPPLLLTASSYILKVDFLLPRYVSYSAPAWAIVSGVMLEKVGTLNKGLGFLVAILFPFFSILSFVRQPIEDWRIASKYFCDSNLDKSKLVLAFTGHTDSLSQEWEGNPTYEAAWLAPIRYYCRNESANPVRHLTFSPVDAHIVNLPSDQLKDKRSVFFVGHQNADWFLESLSRELTKEGFKKRESMSATGITVLKYSKFDEVN